RLVPANDVDLFAAEFIHNVLDAAAPHADARADGVDLGVDRADGDLGAVAGLARHGLDFDDAFGDFGYFHLEKPANEVRCRAGEHDLDLVPRVAHIKDDAADAFAGLVLLAGDLLGAGHEA